MSLYSEYPALQIKSGVVARIRDDVATEDTFRLYLNDLSLAQIVASPSELRELGAGFVVSEGLSREIDRVEVSGNDIRAYAPTDAPIDYELRSSGCIGVRGMPRRVESPLVISPEEIFHVIAGIESDVWKKTGGVHCSALHQGGALVVRCSDIGRHNTLDKVIGWAVLNRVDLSRCVVGCTGRQPAGMISKIANAGIPIVVSKAASTGTGILLAERSMVTLVCFARGDRFSVYTHPERIAGLNDGLDPLAWLPGTKTQRQRGA